MRRYFAVAAAAAAALDEDKPVKIFQDANDPYGGHIAAIRQMLDADNVPFSVKESSLIALQMSDQPLPWVFACGTFIGSAHEIKLLHQAAEIPSLLTCDFRHAHRVKDVVVGSTHRAGAAAEGAWAELGAARPSYWQLPADPNARLRRLRPWPVEAAPPRPQRVGPFSPPPQLDDSYQWQQQAAQSRPRRPCPMPGGDFPGAQLVPLPPSHAEAQPLPRTFEEYQVTFDPSLQPHVVYSPQSFDRAGNDLTDFCCNRLREGSKRLVDHYCDVLCESEVADHKIQHAHGRLERNDVEPMPVRFFAPSAAL